GQLAAVVDNTLYTHGAITKQNYGHIPGRSETIIDLNQWIKELNGWFKSEVHKWQRGASATHLLKYVTPNSSDYSNNESVTFARFFDNKGNYKQLPEAIIRSLKKYIARIVVGHTPIGEVPVLIREDGIELLAADTSGAKNPAMNSKILIQEQVVSLEKQMPNGRKFQMVARLGDNESPFGKLATNDFRIIGTLDNDSYLLHNNVNRYEEYVNIYKKVSPPDLQFKKTAQASLSKQVGCVHAASALL
ncbi:MAG: hypothetical protein H8D23_07190, partial [Candidatus Brocadiales bacterium]|nr:hypothetical protein [Candidatus Brocadiales bacterium]